MMMMSEAWILRVLLRSERRIERGGWREGERERGGSRREDLYTHGSGGSFATMTLERLILVTYLGIKAFPYTPYG
jgi:hypothetical protein